jgi:hypothetical protein
MLKDFKDKKHQPITLKEIREAEAAEERRLQEEAERPVKEATAAILDNHRKIAALAKNAVTSGKPDIDFVISDAIRNRRMTVKQALKFNEAESRRFVEDTPSYFRSDRNSKTITDYLWNQGIRIPDYEAYKLAYERCRYLGLLDERPEPAPEPVTVEPIETEPKHNDALTAGFDLVTGTPREYTQAEIWKMSSSDMKKAFKLWVTRDEDRRPLLKRSRYL